MIKLENRLDYYQKEKYPTIPIRILEAIVDHVDNHTVHGHFVTAVLENNLTEAVFRADSNSLAALADIVRFVYEEIPHSSHGSKERVSAWLSPIPEGRGGDHVT